jgi:Siphovirus Gp157
MNPNLQAAEIARIAEMIAPLCDGDEALLHDMMTGETDIDRIAGRMWEQVARDGETLAGIKERTAALSERKGRIEARQEAFKAGIGKLLRAARLSKLELPEVTLSVRDGKATLRVVSDDAVPHEFCTLVRKPIKATINEAFADAQKLPNWLVREEGRDVVTARVK